VKKKREKGDDHGAPRSRRGKKRAGESISKSKGNTVRDQSKRQEKGRIPFSKYGGASSFFVNMQGKKRRGDEDNRSEK